MSILAIEVNKDNLEQVCNIFENLGGYCENKYTMNDLVTSNGEVLYMYEEYGDIGILTGTGDKEVIYMTIEEYLNKYPYTLDDYIHVFNLGVCRINNMYWDGSQVVYEAINVDDEKQYDNISIKDIERKMTFPSDKSKGVEDLDENFINSWINNTEDNKIMESIAFKGHKTRGNEIVEIFKMFGVDNQYNMTCDDENLIYFISLAFNINGLTANCFRNNFKNYKIFTIEEFERKYPFKVDERVYPINEAENTYAIVEKLEWVNGEVNYIVNVDGFTYRYTVNHLLPQKSTLDGYTYSENTLSTGYCQLDKTVKIFFNKENYEKEVELDLGDYEIVNKDGKVFAVLKTPVYPKTYGECCALLGCDDKIKMKLIGEFIQLINARNAYWKIAGKQMGLGKPWKPEWCNENKLKYCIEWSYGTIDRKTMNSNKGCILAFPTEKMRDTFYENFKDLIELCKELL